MSNYQWIDIGSETQLQTVQNATNCCIVYYFSQITIDPLITEWLDEMNFSYAKVNIMKFRHLVKFELDALPCFQLYSLSNNIYKPLIQIDLDQVKRLTSMHISITSKLKFTNQSKKLNDWLEADETLLIYYFGIENELHLNRLLKLHILSTKYDFPFVAVDTKSMLLKEHLTERQINKTPCFIFQTSGKSNQIEFKDILTQLQEFDTNDIELSQLFTNSFDKAEKQKGITKKMTVKRVIQSDQIDIQSTGLKIPPKLSNLKTWNESETMEDFNQMIAQKLSCILYYETREESIVEPFIGLMLNYGIPTLSINVLKFDIKSFGNVRYATLPVVQIFQFGKTVGQVVSAKDLDLIKTDILEIYPKYSKLRFITKPVTMTSLIELNKFVLVLYFKPTSEEYKTMLENMQILSFHYNQSVAFLLVNCDNLALEEYLFLWKVRTVPKLEFIENGMPIDFKIDCFSDAVSVLNKVLPDIKFHPVGDRWLKSINSCGPIGNETHNTNQEGGMIIISSEDSGVNQGEVKNSSNEANEMNHSRASSQDSTKSRPISRRASMIKTPSFDIKAEQINQPSFGQPEPVISGRRSSLAPGGLQYLESNPNGGKPDSIRAHNTKPRSATITGDRREILELHSAKSVSSNEPKTDHVMNAYIKPSPGSTPPTSVFSSSLSVRRSSEQTNTAEHLELKRDDLISRVSGSKVRLNNSTTIRVTNESDEHVNGSPIQHRISRHNSRKSILETGEPMTSTGTKPSIVRMSSTKSNLKNLAVEDKDTHGEDFGILQTHSRRNSSKKPGIDGYEHHDQPLSRKHTEIHLNKKESDSDPNSEHMNGSPIQHRISRHNSKKSILETSEAMSSKPSPIVKVSSTKSNLKNLAVGDKEAHGEHIVTEKDFGNLQTHSRRNSSKKPGNEGNEHHDQPISRKHTETHSTKKENIVAKEHINTSHKDDKRSYPIEKQSESKVPLEKHESFLPKLIPNTTNSLTVNANPNHPLPKLLPNEHFIESCESLSLEDLSRPMFNRTTIKRK